MKTLTLFWTHRMPIVIGILLGMLPGLVVQFETIESDAGQYLAIVAMVVVGLIATNTKGRPRIFFVIASFLAFGMAYIVPYHTALVIWFVLGLISPLLISTKKKEMF